MNEQRLAEIEAEHDGCEGYIDTMELIAEVRRLQARLDAMSAAGTPLAVWTSNCLQRAEFVPDVVERQHEELGNMVRNWHAAARMEARDEA